MGLIKNFSSYNELIQERLRIEEIERNKYSLLLENKVQAKSILRKKDIREDDPMFVELKEAILDTFNNLNYLGLMTSYMFDQGVSFDEIKDLLPWLKQNSSRLPQEPLKYKEFEKLKDDIITIDNDHKVKVIMNLLPKEQKELVEGDEKFREKAIALHGLGMSKEFGSKVSKYHTKEDIIQYMDDFIRSNSDTINYKTVKEDIKDLNAEILVDDIDNGIIVAEIFDFNTSNKLGSSNWCISTGVGSWNSYTRGARRQFFLWDFSKEVTNSQFQIGFTVNEFGQITNIHDKFDKSLKESLPDVIVNSLRGIDLKFDVLEYKSKVLDFINDSDGDLEVVSSDESTIFIKVTGTKHLNDIITQNISYYNPFQSEDHKYKNIYLLYDFSKEPLDKGFFYIIEALYNGEINKLFIRNNLNRIEPYKADDTDKLNENGLEEVVDLLDQGKIEFMDSTEYFELRKRTYLDKIEPFVKDTKDFNFKSYNYFPTEYINTSDDPTSTGRYWLFKVGDDNGPEELFTHKALSDVKISKFNFYTLIDLEETFDSPNFKRDIKIYENKADVTYGMLTSIKHNKDNINISDLDDDIKQLIDNGYINIRKESEYNKEVSKAWREYKSKIRRAYDSDIIEKAEALIDYLLDSGDLDEEDVYDEDGELIDGIYYDLFSPRDLDDSVEFETYSISDVKSKYGGNSKTWTVVEDDDMEQLAIDRVKELFDDVGPEGFNLDMSYYIEDRFCDYYADDEEYYREVVTESPEDYDIPRDIKEESQNLLDQKQEEHEELETKIKHYKDRIDLIEKRIKLVDEKKDKEVEELEDKLDKYEESEEFDKETYEKMKKEISKRDSLYNRMIVRYETLISKYEDERDDLEMELEEISELIDEIEDEDNDDHWYFDEDQIEEKIEELNKDRINECKRDPIEFMKEIGMDTNSKTMKEYIDVDKLAKDVVDMDGYGHTVNSYDGSADEWSYNGNEYYIYRTN